MAEQSSRPTNDPKSVGQGTARLAVEILQADDSRYRCPTKAERDALRVGFAMRGKTLYGAGYDMVWLEGDVDLTEAEAICEAIDAISICEIKSTNRHTIGDDLRGYFFNITAGELLTAQSVGEKFRFVFVNVVTGRHQVLGLNDVFGKARGLYPAWHIRF